MGYYVFVDNSNVWIEGRYASAVHQGWVGNMYEAHRKNAQDASCRIDFGRLLNFVSEGNIDDVKKAVLIGSKPPRSDSLWNAMKKANFEVSILDRNVANKEKAIDTSIVIAIDKCLYREAKPEDEFILIMGDRDFVPSIQTIHEEGLTVKLVFWSNASGELIAEADDFVNLDEYIDSISFRV